MVVLRKRKHFSSKLKTYHKKTGKKDVYKKRTNKNNKNNKKRTNKNNKKRSTLQRGGGIIPSYLVDIPISSNTEYTKYTNIPIINVKSVRDEAIRNTLI